MRMIFGEAEIFEIFATKFSKGCSFKENSSPAGIQKFESISDELAAARKKQAEFSGSML